MPARIRPFTTTDSAEQLTALLHVAYATLAARGWFAQIQRQVCAADRDEMQGASRSNSTRYCEDEQRSRPPESADAHVAVICAGHPQGWNYTAATQSVQTTRERIAQGQCFVAELLQAQGDLPAGALVGSVCISPPRAAGAHYVQAQDSAPPLYTR
ncbi:MAG: hypothetical protein Q4A97_11140, partial [Comamonadaceae bacterium]|nr:hypothetical protein [Comamonadaceae bacterium]